ncbi:Hypothetical predicted protein [Paramuricea clavata]|uniref:Uncharacterized protein n=1 Tax=Paramuricea clavata TaxID=317549 RepID=A0A7D9HGI0_PARCT|nr:Hypothetical predicted protein [Paramuricea clavata]
MQDFQTWIDKSENVISQLCTEWDGLLVITGDFNIDLLRPEQPQVKQYIDMLESLNLHQHVELPTRTTANSKTLIDHIISNIPSRVTHTGVLPCPTISDHDAPYVCLNVRITRFEPRFKFIRNERQFGENAFLEDVAALPLNIVYSTDEADDKLEIFNSLFKSSINRHAPLRKMKITRPPAPWLNAEDIKQLQSERNKLRHLAHATKKDSIWQLFRGIRNKIKTRIKEAKRSLLPESSIVEKTQRSLAHNPSHLTSQSTKNFCGSQYNTNHSFTLRPATFREVLNEIKGLRSDCSTGTDQIPVKYIKLAADWIASPLTHIIHYISNNSFPKIWKLARVSPIPKTDHPVESDDFRPIAILPALSKIYERLVLKQLLLYIEDHNILHSGMSGYRKGHSTNSVLLRIRDDIIHAMKKGEVTLIAFADFSKAFDTVEYATVFKKLHNVGFSHDAIYWVLNYLTGRKQYVITIIYSNEPSHLAGRFIYCKS